MKRIVIVLLVSALVFIPACGGGRTSGSAGAGEEVEQAVVSEAPPQDWYGSVEDDAWMRAEWEKLEACVGTSAVEIYPPMFFVVSAFPACSGDPWIFCGAHAQMDLQTEIMTIEAGYEHDPAVFDEAELHDIFQNTLPIDLACMKQ